MKTILVLVLHDLAVAFKNKTIYLILFIPLFVFISLRLIDRTDADASSVRIGFIQEGPYDPRIVQWIQAPKANVELTWVQNEEEGKRLLKEKQIDGVLVNNEDVPGSLAILVLREDSIHTLAIVEHFAALQRAAEGYRERWITGIRTLQDGDTQKQTLPTWILMIVLLVGFIILPAQVAEEKEKKLLVALLQTPMHEVQWLVAKLITGMILIAIAVSFLHLLGTSGVDHYFDYIALIAAGSFCFCAYGIFLGFLCRHQAAARTLGVIFYLPHLLPCALSESSQKLSMVAPFLPSYQLYEPLRSVLLENVRLWNMPLGWVYLLPVGVFTLCLSFLLMKRRWLM